MKKDLRIQKEVMAEFKWEPFLNPAEIGVAVSDGVVTLSGQVGSYRKKFGAEKAAWRIRGVKAIVQKIEVVLNGEHLIGDNEIAKMAIETLHQNSLVPKGQIHIRVSDGNVYLNGTVKWFYQKQAAESAVKNLKGIKEIFNLLGVENVEEQVVLEHIKRAIGRCSSRGINALKVEVNKNLVILSGHTRSYAERQCAEIAAWSSPGVSLVENKISVDD